MKRKVLLTTLAALALLTLVPAALRAIPAYPGLLTQRQPDGSLLTYRLVGDEHRHAFVSDDGFLLNMDGQGLLSYAVGADGQRARFAPDALVPVPSAGRPSAAPRRLPSGGFPTTGQVRGLVLLVEFSDVHFQPAYTQSVFQGLLNAPAYSEHGAAGSARDYFVSQSGGLFTPEFDVVGPVRLTETMAYYGADDAGGTDAHAGIMVQESCQKAHDQHGVDFSQYDYNDDGLLDFVYIIYAGYGQNYGASANTVWPHTANLPDWGLSLELDGKTVSRYACGCELKYTQGTQLEGIGTFCHEFGHVLGLPDFYDTRHSNGMRLGAWDIMDQGCYNNESRTPCAYSAFERYSLGWLSLTELTEPSDHVELPELTQNGVAYRLSTSRPDEYFILENRQQTGWDAYLPARGMLIAHVDYDEAAWAANTVNNGADMRYDLMEADGVMSAQTYATDPFPSGGNDRFTDTSSPSALMRDGTPTGKPVTHIRDVNGVITFRFMQAPLERPLPPTVTDVGATTLTATWQPVEGAEGYRLTAQQQLSVEDDPVVADEPFSAMTAGSADQPDDAEMGSVLDSYLNLEGWTGNGLRQAGGELLMLTGGKLTSPLLDLSMADGRFTVALRLRAAAGSEAAFTVRAARTNGREIASAQCTVGEAEQTVVVTLDGGIGRTVLSIESTEGQLLLSHLRVLKDHVAEADVWAEAHHTVVADAIGATTATLHGLLPQQTYAVTLTALAADEELNSAPSVEVLVTTKSVAESIGTMPTADDDAASASAYDLLGRPANGHDNGTLRIVRTPDGKVQKRLLSK